MKTLMITIVVSMATAVAHAAPRQDDSAAPQSSAQGQIDYDRFVQLSAELGAYRQERLIPLSQFNRMTQQDDVLVLDARSAAAFSRGHIEGAVNLPFSDFTDESLAQVIGDTQRPILIYCNNNFIDNIPPVLTKRAELALNIPTFINLYGYGYQNIYELADLVSITDPQVRWIGDTPAATQLSVVPIQ